MPRRPSQACSRSKCNVPYPGNTTEEVAQQGREIYERELRHEVDPEYSGRFLVLDVESGDYEIADEDLDASERLL